MSPPAPCIDMAALGERLWRFRLHRGWSQAQFAQRAGVDPMVLSRLEQRQKPRLEIETAARLARVCGWTLDQLCGLAPVTGLPAAPRTRWWSPIDTPCPAWLQAGLPTTTEEQRLAALVLAWDARGAPAAHIVATLNQWGFAPMSRPSGAPWTLAQVRKMIDRYTYGTTKGRNTLRAAYPEG